MPGAVDDDAQPPQSSNLEPRGEASHKWTFRTNSEHIEFEGARSTITPPRDLTAPHRVTFATFFQRIGEIANRRPGQQGRRLRCCEK
jgi:hypothetical protein